MVIETRKTRFVCISDTHNSTFKLPAGDVLVHAGDLTKQGTLGELRKTIEWIEKSNFEIKILVAGNHDITLDETFYAEEGASFHSQNPQTPKDCIDLLRKSESITYLSHESKTIRLQKAEGPQTVFKVFGSPYSPSKDTWAFQYSPEEAQALWDQIPLDIDVLITHTPPKLHCDVSKNKEPAGCETLKEALWRVRPRLSVCGHVHEGRGAELVTWDLGCPNIGFKEKFTTHWVDPSVGSKKQALLDLSAKGGNPLDWREEDLRGNIPAPANPEEADERPSRPKVRGMKSYAFLRSKSSEKSPITKQPSLNILRSPTISKTPRTGSNSRPVSKDSRSQNSSDVVIRAGSSVRGRGGSPTSGRSDREALAGRLGRKQTCVVNAAIMATSWPYKGSGGERYNKPIVVDIDLPVWSGDADPEAWHQ